MNNGIKTSGEVFGVRYWAQWWPTRTPKYELFKYFGFSPETGLYYFNHKRHPKIWLTKNFNQLASDPSFRPFLLDTAKMGVEYLVPGGPSASN